MELDGMHLRLLKVALVPSLPVRGTSPAVLRSSLYIHLQVARLRSPGSATFFQGIVGPEALMTEHSKASFGLSAEAFGS